MPGIYFLREKEAYPEVYKSSAVGILKMCGTNQWKTYFIECFKGLEQKNFLFFHKHFRGIGTVGKIFKATKISTFSENQSIFIFPYFLSCIMLLSFSELTKLFLYILIQKKTSVTVKLTFYYV